MRKLTIVFLLLFLSIYCFPQSKIKKVVGTYKQCFFGCWIITIRPDFTFSYQPMGDVGAPHIVEGKWKFEDDNILVANTVEQPDNYILKSFKDAKRAETIIRVLDENDKPVEGANVSLGLGGNSVSATTDLNGEAHFEKCEPMTIDVRNPWSPFENSVAQFRVKKGEDANIFETKIKFIALYLTDERWLVQNGKLYVIESAPLEKSK